MVSFAPLEGIVYCVEERYFIVVVYQSQYHSVISVFDDVAVWLGEHMSLVYTVKSNTDSTTEVLQCLLRSFRSIGSVGEKV